jgi:hypothetical protein
MRAAGVACWCEKNLVLALVFDRAEAPACRSEYRRFALVGVMGICPRIRPAWRTWSPETRPMLPNRPLWKSAALIPEMPFATLALR